MKELGIANVVARSAFVNTVNEEACLGCGACVEACSFDALTLDYVVKVNEVRCVGCGVCVPVCPQQALALIRRPGEQAPPPTEQDWRTVRQAADIQSGAMRSIPSQVKSVISPPSSENT